MQLVYIYEQNKLSDFSTVSVFFSKNQKLNDKATMMGYRHKTLNHKYVYNKIKEFLLMIW